MICADHLSKVFQPHRGEPIAAVKGVSFTIDAGEIVGILGPNGAGKTTLLRMLGTILAPTSGTCTVCGFRTDEQPDEVRRRVGFLSGNTKLYRRLTPAEILRYFGRLYGMTDGAIRERTDHLSAMLDMGSFLDRRCESLSTGQTQKTSIARAILHEPQVLILDEAILDFKLDAKARGHTIIFSTHYMTEAEMLCDRVGLIHQGTMLGLGTQADLFAETGTDNLKDAFLKKVDAGGVPA
jgi:sodium transport system ATP-binding protein